MLFFSKCSTFSVVLVINIPAEIVTALAWAGPNLDVLIVTTWSKAIDSDTGAISSTQFSKDSGKIFTITGLGATGLSANSICI